MSGDVRYIRNPAVTETSLDDEVFLVEPDSGEVFYLNAITSGLWNLFAEPASRAEARETYAAAFPDAPAPEVEDDVGHAIDEMCTRRLIVEIS